MEGVAWNWGGEGIVLVASGCWKECVALEAHARRMIREIIEITGSFIGPVIRFSVARQKSLV